MNPAEGTTASLTVGKRLRSQNSTCEVVVVRAAASGSALTCAGAEMGEGVTGPGSTPVGDGPAVQIGKRYVDDEAGLEVLCVKGGTGPLAFDGRELTVKTAKSLPASD